MTTALSDIVANELTENSEWVIVARVKRSDVAIISISEMKAEATGWLSIKSRIAGCRGAVVDIISATFSSSDT
jgi:hypothetical protein